MDALSAFFQAIKDEDLARGHLLGFLHVMIGRRISRGDGTVISSGLSWRELANILKKIRYDPETVRELGIDPDSLPPRDRFRFWNLTIGRARVDSPEAVAAGDRFADVLRQHGYDVGTFPSRST